LAVPEENHEGDLTRGEKGRVPDAVVLRGLCSYRNRSALSKGGDLKACEEKKI